MRPATVLLLVESARTAPYGGSLHFFLANRHGLRLRRTVSLIGAVSPQQSDSDVLQIPAGQSVLRVKSVNAREPDGQPIEYVVTRFRADSVQLRVDLA